MELLLLDILLVVLVYLYFILGSRQIATLLPEMKRTGAKKAIVSMCIGTGMGAAALIESEWLFKHKIIDKFIKIYYLYHQISQKHFLCTTETPYSW